MRNFAVAASGDAVIAVGGKWGTLSEIAFAKLLGRPVVILEPGWELDGVDRAATPEDAVAFVLNAL
jgi:predicted Rossmann-fold nucleotide-binding protein